jgi:peptide/nickel transport system ATP-binding protein
VLETNRDLDRAAAREEAVAMLRAVDIPEPAARYDDYPHQLSRGLCQRVLLAMAVGCEPGLIVADEPTTALDVTIEAGILETVRALTAR